MPIALRDVVVPDFGLPLEVPRIPATTYEKRWREAYARAAGRLRRPPFWLASGRLLALV
jgi:hypothetical protein